VAEHSLHGFNVRAGRNGQGRRRVTQVVQSQSGRDCRVGQTCSFSSASEPPATVSGCRLEFMPAAEHEQASVFASTQGTHWFGQERRERHAAYLVPFGRSADDAPPHIDRIGLHEDAASDEIDTVDPQSDNLAPSQAGVGEEENQGGVLTGFVREYLDLFVAEIVPLLPECCECTAS